MEQQNYQCSFVVDNTPKEAFEAINHVADWWSKNFTGASEKPGDVFTVTFGETFSSFQITESIAGRKVIWLTTDCNLHWLKDKKEWKGTKVSFEIIPRSKGAQIDMTHIGLVPGIECYTNCIKGWDFYIKTSLFKLLTEGKGIPDDPDHSGRDEQ